ncbi:MAG: hypothetical protein PHC41_07215 [Lachnospiraceae bacterium]|nr:hypothetical protein [Lachnospiraceae bacterium]MDD3616003.1 hypothetical protein [Lachnospiraceae bacterium]
MKNEERTQEYERDPGRWLRIGILVVLAIVIVCFGWYAYKNYLAPSSGSAAEKVVDDTSVGCIKYLDCLVYFDKSGIVTKTEVYQKVLENQESESTEDKTAEKTQESADTETGEDAASVDSLPYVEGLTVQSVCIGQKLKIENADMFDTVAVLDRILMKLGDIPDRIVFDAKNNISLYYGQVEVMLGEDYLLEEKMNRASAILPQLDGMEGILHLEDYEKGTENIIFEKSVAEEITQDDTQAANPEATQENGTNAAEEDSQGNMTDSEEENGADNAEETAETDTEESVATQ